MYLTLDVDRYPMIHSYPWYVQAVSTGGWPHTTITTKPVIQREVLGVPLMWSCCAVLQLRDAARSEGVAVASSPSPIVEPSRPLDGLQTKRQLVWGHNKSFNSDRGTCIQ